MQNLIWFRSDLRVSDNTALSEASKKSDALVGVFLLAEEQWRQHGWGASKINFLLRNLRALSEKLEEFNIPLVVLENSLFDDAPSSLLTLAKELRSETLFFNYEYEWNERVRDRAVQDAFHRAGLTTAGFHDQVVLAPNDPSLVTQQGKPYTIFTPFRARWIELAEKRTLPKLYPLPEIQKGSAIKATARDTLVSSVNASQHICALWPEGELEAMRRLEVFCAHQIKDYEKLRDIPSVSGTSSLSPYLAVGAISPRECIAAAMKISDNSLTMNQGGASCWMSELVWREFYRHVIIHHPRVSKNRAFREEIDEGVPWRYDKAEFERWIRGETGYPLIDAAMRSLERDGWMHNRLRMVVAMFLTKHLLIDWRWGEKHFAKKLIDIDLASNNGGWQWSASVGTDAAPYFRIFNPWSQSKKFDPEGVFIKKYCPELREVKSALLHDPKKLRGAIEGGLDYPFPMVEHKSGRERALKAFKG